MNIESNAQMHGKFTCETNPVWAFKILPRLQGMVLTLLDEYDYTLTLIGLDVRPPQAISFRTAIADRRLQKNHPLTNGVCGMTEVAFPR